MNERTVGVLAVLSCLVLSCQGITNPLGSGLGFDLLPFDGSFILKYWSPGGTIHQACQENDGMRHIGTKATESALCAAKLKSKSIFGGNTPSKTCNAARDFIKCASKITEDLAKACKVSVIKRVYIKAKLKVYNIMTEKLCEKNGGILEMVKKAGSCTAEKSDELKKCRASNIEPSMKYDAVGCKAAWGFTDCVTDKLDKCPTFGDKIKSVFSAGLEATACKQYKPKKKSGDKNGAARNGPVLLALFFGILAAGFLM